jgi:hypothetical protein
MLFNKFLKHNPQLSRYPRTVAIGTGSEKIIYLCEPKMFVANPDFCQITVDACSVEEQQTSIFYKKSVPSRSF